MIYYIIIILSIIIMLTIMKFPKPGEAARPDEQIVWAHVSFGEMNTQNNKRMMITSEKTENKKQIIVKTIMII